MEQSHALIQLPGIPAYVTYSWLAMIILVTAAVIVRTTMELIPRGFQNFIETLVEALYDLCEDNLGKHWAETLFPLIGTLGLYILLCNLMGLLPGFECPTANINTTASCAVPVFLLTHYYGLKVHKLSYFKHFVGPIRSVPAIPLMILMFIVEVIGHIARPLTLSVRLFGNMISKHLILGVLALLAPAIIPTAILGLGVLVSVVQAFVFVLLTILYLSGSVAESH
ncbi:MAG: F0F1 ATP synthase subunit A [Nitrospirae bacterium]|nr:F0F1 ATP synthase subunit A [Nitrospirota bacterium]MBF0540575.1 F0F1 ATP synthase subunit A [Nitrospirota bacterium]